MLTKRRRSEDSGARPVMSLRQEKAGRLPWATASSASEMAAIAGSMSSSVVFPSRRPSIDCEIAPRTPRNVGSAESVPRNGSALMSWASVAPHLIDREEQHAIAGEEGAAVGPDDGAEEVRSRLKRFGERGRGLFGGFRGCCVDDSGDEVGPLREFRVELDLLLAPGQRTREQLAAVGRDRDVARDIAGGKRRYDDEACDDKPSGRGSRRERSARLLRR